MRVTITFDAADERDDEVIEIAPMKRYDDDGSVDFAVSSNEYDVRINHKHDDGPIALLERAIYKLRRMGLR